MSGPDAVSKSQTQQFFESPDQLLVLLLSVTDLCWLQPIHVQHSQVFCLFRPSRMWITFNRFSTIFEVFVPHFIWAALIASSPKTFWIIWIVSMDEMFKLIVKFDAVLLLYSLSHFECDGHTVHMLTQQHLPPLLTSTVKLPLFICAQSSLLSFPWLLGYIDVMQTIVILIMAGHFLDRPCVCVLAASFEGRTSLLINLS